MDQREARALVRTFVRDNTGVDADPDWIRRDGRFWRAYYGAEHFYRDEMAAGMIIDGGEYILDVNDDSGEVSVFA
jgi:hypothetical protein